MTAHAADQPLVPVIDAGRVIVATRRPPGALYAELDAGVVVNAGTRSELAATLKDRWQRLNPGQAVPHDVFDLLLDHVDTHGATDPDYGWQQPAVPTAEGPLPRPKLHDWVDTYDVPDAHKRHRLLAALDREVAA